MEPAVNPNYRNQMQSNLVKSFISDLTPYLGEYDDLSRFLADVEDIIPPLTELDPLETLIRFKQITQKLRGKARRILQEKPETWEEVRSLLIRECADRMDIGSQIVAMERVGYAGTIYKTYERLLYWQIRMIDKIELGTDPAEEKTLLINSVRRRCYLQLRKSLPQACQGALTSRNCQSLTDAIKILHEEDFLTYDRYHEDRRAPHRSQNHLQQNDRRHEDRRAVPRPQNQNQQKTFPNNQSNRYNNSNTRQNQNQNSNYRQNYGTQNQRQQPRQNNRDNNSGQHRNPKPWRFHQDNFAPPVQYLANGDTEPMDIENFYLTPQTGPGPETKL